VGARVCVVDGDYAVCATATLRRAVSPPSTHTPPFPQQQDLCAKIIEGKYSAPETISAPARDLLARMLTVDPAKRITFPQVGGRALCMYSAVLYVACTDGTMNACARIQEGTPTYVRLPLTPHPHAIPISPTPLWRLHLLYVSHTRVSYRPNSWSYVMYDR
jgi:hypothetical protein